MHKSLLPVFLAGLVACLCPGLHAGVLAPVDATSTTEINSSRGIEQTINGTLLSSGGTSGDILSETVSFAGSAGHWLSSIDAIDDDANFRSTTETLIFDLGGSFDVDRMHLWPYIRSERARGIRTLDISFSTDGGATFPTTVTAGTFPDFVIGPSGGTDEVQTRTFTPQSGVTHIRLTNLTTFGSTNYIAISELRFGGPDLTVPTLSSTVPGNGATGVPVGGDLVATFSEPIALGSAGTVTIRNLGPGSDPDEVITLPDGRLSVSGTDLTINPASDLAPSNSYAVRISAGAVEDLATVPNAFAGILDDVTWSFQTAADAVPPGISPPTSPADDATGVNTLVSLVITFDEPVLAGSGSITIRNLTTASDTVIPVGDSQVTVSGSSLTVDPTGNLDPGADLAILLDPGVVSDSTGNPFAGIADETTWNFSTAADVSPPVIQSLSPADEATGVSVASTLEVIFDEAIVAAVLPPLLDEDFEGGDGGFAVATAEGSGWARGTPDSSSPGGTVSSGNGGSATCWGTNLGAYAGGAGNEGYYAVPTTTCLRSAVIDLSGLTAAELSFAEARDLAVGDTAVVNIIEDLTDTVIAAAVYTAPSNTAAWAETGAIDLAAGLGRQVRIEWCLTGMGGGTNDYLGWYIDDVLVTGTGGGDNGITVKNLTEGTETVYAAGDPEVSIAGAVLSIDPDGGLDAGDSYAVRVGSSALADQSGNLFAGIADDTTWNFTVEVVPAVITPTEATASSTIGSPRVIERTIDGSDLSGGGTSGNIFLETHTNNNSNSGGYWLSTNTGGNVAGEVLTFTLPGAHDVNAVHIWGYNRNGSTSRSIRNFDLSFSSDGGSTFPVTLSAASLGDLGGPADPIPVQTLAFANQGNVTHIQISNITNFGDGNYVGLSEIRFGGTPSSGGGDTFAGWIAGFPGVGGQTGLADDADGDGQGNGVENFFGTPPDSFSEGLTAGTAGGGIFTFTHPQGGLAGDLSAGYRWSKDLQVFNADGAADGDGTTVTFSVQPDTPVAGTATVTATVTAGPVPSALYVEVEVTQP